MRADGVRPVCLLLMPRSTNRPGPYAGCGGGGGGRAASMCGPLEIGGGVWKWGLLFAGCWFGYALPTPGWVVPGGTQHARASAHVTWVCNGTRVVHVSFGLVSSARVNRCWAVWGRGDVCVCAPGKLCRRVLLPYLVLRALALCATCRRCLRGCRTCAEWKAILSSSFLCSCGVGSCRRTGSVLGSVCGVVWCGAYIKTS